MTKWLLSAALILSAFPSSTIAQTKEALVGTWKLVSYTTTNDKGEVEHGMGMNPIGALTYTADGRVSVFMADSERKQFFAYAGSYSLAGDKVTHHIEISIFQGLVNTDQVRSVRLEGDHLTMRGGFVVGGATFGSSNNELVWERMKPNTADMKK
jgi:hypothetical protein